MSLPLSFTPHARHIAAQLSHPPDMSVEILSPPVPGQDPPQGDSITAQQVVELLRLSQRTPMPDSEAVFPWLHGVASAKCAQTTYFENKSASTDRNIPHLFIPIKVGGGKGPQLLNSVYPHEVLQQRDGDLCGEFIDSDPCTGVNLRNLELQAAKCIRSATILVYSFDAPEKISAVAQLLLKAKGNTVPPVLVYNGVCSEIAEIDSTLIANNDNAAYDPLHQNAPCQWDLNFAHFSRLEILHMAKASKIDLKGSILWLGNAMDASLGKWKTLVECVASPQMPSISTCDQHIRYSGNSHELSSTVFEFPASDVLHPATLSANDVVLMLNMCKAVHARSANALSLAVSPEGYRGNSVFAILYGMFVTGLSMANVIVLLYRDHDRPLLCSDADVEVMRTLEALFVEFSPHTPLAKSIDGAISSSKVAAAFGRLTAKMYETPHDALSNFKGSLPSRIMNHMYLGGLTHAESPELLKELGITRVLSVGERLPWVDYTTSRTYSVQGIEVHHLPCILDDGLDSLLPILGEALQFLQTGRESNRKTLVHCRVGVSRSAAICIAEVMHLTGWCLPRAYLYVRVRRLNLIIQPNLRFLYELVKVEEHLNALNGRAQLRQMEWPVLCREIAKINS